MIRLALPAAAAALFFLLSLITVRVSRPRAPRQSFLVYELLLLVATAGSYVRLWPLARPEDALGLVACVLLQTGLCLTIWNTFYGVLWGFSCGLCHDLYRDASLRRVDRLVRAYEGEAGVDRMLARRLPNLVRGGYVAHEHETLRLRPKGRLTAWATLAAFKIFSLGLGGGIKGRQEASRG